MEPTSQRWSVKRVVDVSSGARLSLVRGQMVIHRPDKPDALVPVEDLGVLILDNPALTCSQRLLATCAENGVAVLVCDSRHLPSAILSPVAGNSLHTRILAGQIAASVPTKKRIWRDIVREKIRRQAEVYARATGRSHKELARMADKVRSGDPDNVESQAARFYWPALFGRQFRRNTDAAGINSLLNYGYAILRAVTARAITGAGLHPALGVHHHNQYDPFCLADDLMEPLRPLADWRVWQIARESSGDAPEINPETKRALLEILPAPCDFSGMRMPLMSAMHHYAAGLRRALTGEQKNIIFPRP